MVCRAHRSEELKSMDFHPVAMVVKDILKKRGITYKILGKHLGLSESGVKKLLNSKDCSFNRLNNIASFLEISVTDILSLTEQSKVQKIHFSPEVQEYFLADPSCFLVYFCILYDNSSVEDLENRLQLTKAEVYHHLKTLDNFELIRWHSEDKIDVKTKLGLVDGDKEFITFFKHLLANKIHEDSIANMADLDLFIVKYFYSTKETYDELKKDIDEAIASFERQSLRDQRIFGKSGIHPRKLLVYSSSSLLL